MASYVGEVVIGDYRYTLYDDRTARARVTDDTKASYGALRSSVTYSGVTYRLTSLVDCFMYCYSLTTAPTIPDVVTAMNRCFYECLELTAAPEIPEGVTNLHQCFYHCPSMTAVASIPSTVTDLGECFRMCSALTGTIRVAGAPTYYSNCFVSTTLPIVLDATRTAALSTWQAVAATSSRGNVTVTYPSDNPAPTGTINATRVASAGSTTSDESGRYVYVQVATTVSTDRAPYNVAQAPTITVDGTTVTPTQTSGTASWYGWVALSDDYAHTIGATPNDLYKSGITVTATLPSTYSPMEFHATGDGASFGKHATRSGVLDVAWDIESEGDVKAAGDVADGAGTLDEVRQKVELRNLVTKASFNLWNESIQQGNIAMWLSTGGRVSWAFDKTNFALSYQPNGGTESVVGKVPFSTSSSPLLKTYSLQATMTAGNNHVAITAPTIAGYSFVCWVGVATVGWVNWSYIEYHNRASTNIWTSTVDRQRAFYAVALYVKSV